jgi:hypothetical protein
MLFMTSRLELILNVIVQTGPSIDFHVFQM